MLPGERRRSVEVSTTLWVGWWISESVKSNPLRRVQRFPALAQFKSHHAGLIGLAEAHSGYHRLAGR